jgi:ketohexokinase
VAVCLKGFDSAEPFLQYMCSDRRTAPGAVLVVPWGEKGAYGAICPASGGGGGAGAGAVEVVFAPAFTVSSVVDSIGAGDTFIAGFLHATVLSARGLATMDLRARLSYACRLAGKKVAQKGYTGLDLSSAEWAEAMGGAAVPSAGSASASASAAVSK